MKNKKELTLQELENQLYIHEMELIAKKEEKEINTLDKYFNINIVKKNNIVY